jgi:hypothetical protein
MKKLVLILVFVSLATVTAVAAQRPGKRAKSRTWAHAPKRDGGDPQALAQKAFAAAAEQHGYRGIVVKAHPQAIGEDLQLHQRIGALMSSLDFVPAQRAEHFRWIDELQVAHTGWDATIQETTPAPGGVHVKVKVVPTNASGAAAVNSYVIENYLYSEGSLRYLGMEETHQAKVITIN